MRSSMNWYFYSVESILMTCSVILPTLRIECYAFDAMLQELVSSRSSARYDLLIMF